MVQTEQTPITTFNTIKLQLNCNLRWKSNTNTHYSDIPILMLCTHTQTLTQIITHQKNEATHFYMYIFTNPKFCHTYQIIPLPYLHHFLCIFSENFFGEIFSSVFSLHSHTFFSISCHLTPSTPCPIYLFARPIARFLSHSKQSHTHKKTYQTISLSTKWFYYCISPNSVFLFIHF